MVPVEFGGGGACWIKAQWIKSSPGDCVRRSSAISWGSASRPNTRRRRRTWGICGTSWLPWSGRPSASWKAGHAQARPVVTQAQNANVLHEMGDNIRRIWAKRVPLQREWLLTMDIRGLRMAEEPLLPACRLFVCRCVKLTPGVYYLPMCGGVSIMARNRQITTKTPSPAATIIVSTSLYVSTEQFDLP